MWIKAQKNRDEPKSFKLEKGTIGIRTVKLLSGKACWRIPQETVEVEARLSTQFHYWRME